MNEGDDSGFWEGPLETDVLEGAREERRYLKQLKGRPQVRRHLIVRPTEEWRGKNGFEVRQVDSERRWIKRQERALAVLIAGLGMVAGSA